MSFFATDKDLRKVPAKRTNGASNPNAVQRRVAATTASTNSKGEIETSRALPLPLPHPLPLSLPAHVPLYIPKASTSSLNTSSISGAEDLVATARLERDNRLQLKQQAQRVIRIQSWYRGRRDCKKYYCSIMQSLNAQLQDVAKVRSLIYNANKQQQQQQPFVVPLNVAINQLNQILLVIKHGRKASGHFSEVFASFCTQVLCPSSDTDDQSKNILLAFDQQKLTSRTSNIQQHQKLTKLLMFIINEIVYNKNETSLLVVYSNTINSLLFDTCNVNSSHMTRIASSKHQLRNELFGYGLISEIRRHILLLTTFTGKFHIEDFESFDIIKQKIMKQYLGTANATSTLFSLARRIVTSSDNIENAEDLMKFRCFVKDILSIPFIPLLIYDSQLVDIITEKSMLIRVFDIFLGRISNSGKQIYGQLLEELEQSIDGRDVSRLQYLIANVTSIFSPSVIKLLAKSNEIDDELMLPLLDFVIKYISKIYVSDFSNDSLNISWKVSGSRFEAREKPKLFVLQYGVLFDRSFLNLLFDSMVLSDVNSNIDMKQWANSKDEADIASALASSSSGLVNKKLSSLQASWFGSSWAARLGLSSSGSTESRSATKGLFSWFSGLGKKSSSTSETRKAKFEIINKKYYQQVIRLWALTITPASNAIYTSKSWKALSALTFSRPVIPFAWFVIQEQHQGYEDLCLKFRPEDTKNYSILTDSFCCLSIFLACLKVYLIALDDIELYDQQKPLPFHQVLPLIRGSNALLFKFLRFNAQLNSEEFTIDSLMNINVGRQVTPVLDCYCATIKNLHFVLADFSTRWARKPFSTVDTWLVSETNTMSLTSEKIGKPTMASAILQWMPWSIDFSKRMKYVRDELDRERQAIQGGHDPYGFGGGFRSQGTIVRIRRSQVMNDGMRSLLTLSSEQWKDRIVVRYINELGMEEAGIDVGGLFKDFVTDLSSSIFDPSYGLFSQTSQGLLYPNPSAGSIYQNTELEEIFLFIGRVLGKAMCENITISPQFTHFFLAFMHGRYNFMNLIEDLYTLDADLFKNLMFLKNCDENIVEDLCLTFSVSDNSFGENREIDLIPGGSKREVTSKNRNWYISAVAKYYLHDRIRVQAGAFFRGLHQMVNPTFLKLFCPPELQILISGSINNIEVSDWKSHSRYAGGYTSMDHYITQFWSVVDSMTEVEKTQLLRFVTSVPRPPSLGFAALNPPFTIQRVDVDDDGRLPTASTCFNILKLPRYSNKAILKEKLLLAITSRSGFDLS